MEGHECENGASKSIVAANATSPNPALEQLSVHQSVEVDSTERDEALVPPFAGEHSNSTETGHPSSGLSAAELNPRGSGGECEEPSSVSASSPAADASVVVQHLLATTTTHEQQQLAASCTDDVGQQPRVATVSTNADDDNGRKATEDSPAFQQSPSATAATGEGNVTSSSSKLLVTRVLPVADACGRDGGSEELGTLTPLRFSPIRLHIEESFWRAVADEMSKKVDRDRRSFSNESIRMYLPRRTASVASRLPSNVAYADSSSLLLHNALPGEPCIVVPGMLLHYPLLKDLETMDLNLMANALTLERQKQWETADWSQGGADGVSSSMLAPCRIFCHCDFLQSCFFFRAYFPSNHNQDVSVIKRVSVDAQFGAAGAKQLRDYVVANRNSLPEVFVVSPDPLKPAGLGLVTKPFTPQAALVKGAVVAFCDSSTSAECPGHLLWNVIMAMRTTAASAALRAAFEADRQANVRQSALFLAVRDVGLAPGSSDVLHLCWPRLDAVAKGGGAGELVAVSGSPAVPRGLFDGGKIQALDLGRVLAKPAPRTFSGRLVFVGSVQVLPRTNEADILCPRVAPVGEWLSQSLNWDEVDTIGRYKPLVIVKDIPGLILPLLTDFANSQSSGKPQRYPLVVAVWVGDHDMEQGVSVVEIQICVKQATDLILSFGAWPLLLTVPALTEKAAAARPDVQKKRWLFADWMRGLQAPDAQVIKAVKAQSPMILVCDPFRDTSDPVSALLHNDLADWSGGCLNTHGAAVVGTVLSKKLSALFSQKR